VATLQHIQGKIHSKEGKEKLKFLADFFDQKQFISAAGIHHSILDVKTREIPPECQNCQEMKDDSVDTLCSEKGSQHCSELVGILNKPHVKVGAVISQILLYSSSSM